MTTSSSVLHVMTGTSPIRAEGWLIKSRDHGIRFPILKSKWARRFYKIRQDENDEKVFYLDEFRDDSQRRPRKSLKLDHVVQIDSHLRLADSSCASRGGLHLQWIFSIHIPRKNESKISEIYLAAESEHDMNVWVFNLCRACGLRKEDETPQMPGMVLVARGDMVTPSMEMPSTCSFDIQSLDSVGHSELSSMRTASAIGHPYQHLRNFHSPSTPSTIQKRSNHHRSGSGADISSLSSVNSSHHSISTEDDSSSCSGILNKPPPYVPPRSRPSRGELDGNSYNEYDLNGHIPPPSKSLYDERMDNESSGETITLHDLSLPMAPPIIDRSLKPNRLPAIPRTTPRVKNHNPTTPTSSHSTTQFEYLEPMDIQRSPIVIKHSIPDHQLDYIKIDASKTKAIAQTLAHRPE